MNTINKAQQASQIVEDFLSANPNPTDKDWTQLILTNPTYANYLAESAITYSQADANVFDASDVSEDTPLSTRTVSYALNLAHTKPTPEVLQAQRRVEAVKGPAARSLATELGLNNTEIMNHILVGAVRTPARILEAMGERFDVSIAALQESFRRSYGSSVVPAHKTSGGQPTVAIEPMSWEDAIRGLKLSESETERLLKFGD